MGFSVSGATALILVAFLLSFGTFYSAASGAFGEIQDAQLDQNDRNLEAINTEIEIGSATYNSGDLVISANNTGASTLDINDTDLLVNGEYIGGWQDDAEIDDEPDSFLWLPQEELTIELDETEEDEIDIDEDDPGRVKIVTEHGRADTKSIEVV